MQIPFEIALGWRYTRAGRAMRRNGFISFISGASMLGIALGVAALIIVLSVMNGFQKRCATACSAWFRTSKFLPRWPAHAGRGRGHGAGQAAS